MLLEVAAANIIISAFSKNERVKKFKSDMISGFIDWIEPAFLVKDEKLKKGLEEEEISDKTKRRLEVKLEDALENEEFKKSLEKWIEDLKKHEPLVRRKLILDDVDIETDESFHMGDAQYNPDEQWTEKGIITNSKIKTKGDFTLGDGHQKK